MHWRTEVYALLRRWQGRLPSAFRHDARTGVLVFAMLLVALLLGLAQFGQYPDAPWLFLSTALVFLARSEERR